jgi:hypothetical protein
LLDGSIIASGYTKMKSLNRLRVNPEMWKRALRGNELSSNPPNLSKKRADPDQIDKIDKIIILLVILCTYC